MPITPEAAKRLLWREVDEDKEEVDEYTPDSPSITYYCEVLGTKLSTGCGLRACPLWVDHEEFFCCAGAYASLKSAHANERLADAPPKDHVRLQDAANGRLSYVDMSLLYRVSRQKVEQLVHSGRECVKALIPVFRLADPVSDIVVEEDKLYPVFTHVHKTDKLCSACECLIEDDYAIVSGDVVWCSEECYRELSPIAYEVIEDFLAPWDTVLSTLEKSAYSVGDIAEAMGVTDTDVRSLLSLRERIRGNS